MNIQEIIALEIEEGNRFFAWPRHDEVTTPHAYNILAVNGSWSAFLYRDGEFFLVTANRPTTLNILNETSMMGMLMKNEPFLILRHPVALQRLVDWQRCARELWNGIVCRAASAA